MMDFNTEDYEFAKNQSTKELCVLTFVQVQAIRRGEYACKNQGSIDKLKFFRMKIIAAFSAVSVMGSALGVLIGLYLKAH
jgi:hypothetical protein